jgi:hypothetical protein
VNVKKALNAAIADAEQAEADVTRLYVAESRVRRRPDQAFPAQGPRAGPPDLETLRHITIASRSGPAGREVSHGTEDHPFGLRLGITEAHRSRWYAPKALYGELLSRTRRSARSSTSASTARTAQRGGLDIHIERTREELKDHHQDRPPGRGHRPQGRRGRPDDRGAPAHDGPQGPISIIEVKNPDLDAKLVAEACASSSQACRFRRVVKMKCEAVMRRAPRA